MSQLTPKEAAGLLAEQDRVLVLTHRRPDGDTIGCAAALCAVLRRRGKTAYMLPNPDITGSNAPYAQGYWAPEGFAPAFVVSVDISAKSLFYPESEPYFDRIGLAVDHHPSFEGFGEHQCVDPSRAACGEIVYEICSELGDVDPEVALPLYVAVATDTGCFLYANTTANTHRVAAALMETGIDYVAVNQRHFRTKSRRRIALEAEVMEGMEFFDGERGMFLVCSQELIKRLNATPEDTEDLSMLAGTVEGVDCGVVLKEHAPGVWKISLRTGSNGRVSATGVCQLFGGGGHAMAAGAIQEGTLEEVKARIRKAVEQVKKF